MLWFALRAGFWLTVVYAFLPPDGEVAREARRQAGAMAETASREIMRLCDDERALCEAAADAPAAALSLSGQALSEAADALEARADRRRRER